MCCCKIFVSWIFIWYFFTGENSNCKKKIWSQGHVIWLKEVCVHPPPCKTCSVTIICHRHSLDVMALIFFLSPFSQLCNHLTVTVSSEPTPQLPSISKHLIFHHPGRLCNVEKPADTVSIGGHLPRESWLMCVFIYHVEWVAVLLFTLCPLYFRLHYESVTTCIRFVNASWITRNMH